ncbi:tetratricopeptide repeat-containing sulfotransferase family protein [Oricola thermophila]|uniref:Tetratricopeptide repeat protein n=1 Tax=Oricola thermophila TaxID=2742145 RepID=A0A6N1VIF3_9HYPH|nr:tetratricopeptide repeat-containing sulfotransferase family protein [Oricola thermophila]QKV19505.1 tetratricopeptide repeat protein [Oricola thermophila]
MTASHPYVNQALQAAASPSEYDALSGAKQVCRRILDKIPKHGRAPAALRAPQQQGSEAALPQEADEAIDLFRQGRLEEARAEAASLVARYPRAATMHNLLGSIEAGLGHSLRAIGSFRRAVALMPELLEPKLNLAEALGEVGRQEEAADILARATRSHPDSADAHDRLGAVLQALGRHEAAAESHRKAIDLNPRSAQAHINLGRALSALGKVEEATRQFAKAARLESDSGQAFSCLGAGLTGLGRPRDGIKACHRAIELSPGNAQAYVDLAEGLEGVGEIESARQCLERALALKPDHAGAHSALCGLHRRAGDEDGFRAALEKARRQCGEDDPRIRFRIAQLAETEDAPLAARRIAEGIPDGRLPAIMEASRLMLLGRVMDRQGDHAQAFELARRANDSLGATPLARNLDPAAFLRDIESLTASFAGFTEKPWQDPPDAPSDAPVFLVGPPGTGGGFIDAVLADHPSITVVEEKPMVARMRALIDGPADCERLEALSPSELEAMRHAYYGELNRHAGSGNAGAVIVDKLPLNIIHAGLISRVFPSAKFLFAAQHPCNSVLACYMDDPSLDAVTANFLDLETGATFYDRVMRLWSTYRQMLHLDVHVLSCEAPPADRRQTVRAMLQFLDLDPSYLLIERGTTRPGWWENYREQLEPVLPLLESWARHPA